MAILDVQGVSKRFNGLRALDNVTLAVEEGSVHAIIGPNGAGKSTLLNVLTGSIEPDAGSVVFDGQALLQLRPHQINQLGIARVFQSPEIFPELSVLENVLIASLAARDGSYRSNLVEHPGRSRDLELAAEEILVEVGLTKHLHTPAVRLSRGDKRRLELAICLAHRPRLLLLDEPTAGMSQAETHSTVELLQKIAATGVTKIIIEHDMDVVFALSSRITVLHQGQVIADGPPDAVRENPAVQEAYLGGAEL
jgi:branched-chain amino acid transport system ATP-binding protein